MKNLTVTLSDDKSTIGSDREADGMVFLGCAMEEVRLK